jgi:hypothetical protein
MNLSASIIHPSCPTPVSDGAIDLSVTGGAGTYTYDWSNDGFEMPDNDPQDLTAIGAGMYTVVVTDANGCTATTTAVLVSIKGLPNPPSGVNH